MHQIFKQAATVAANPGPLPQALTNASDTPCVDREEP